MNEVTYTLTQDDWVAYWNWQIATNPKTARTPHWKQHIQSLSIAIAITAIYFLQVGFRFPAIIFAFVGSLLSSLLVSHLLDRWMQRIPVEWATTHHPTSETRMISLQPRGVMELTEFEESLTLWDAITEVHSTETFLFAKDKRGGILLVPVRAFGSETAMKAFAMEIENRRMRHAVGLTPAVPAVAPQTVTVTPPPQEAPQQQVTAGWWRKPQ